MCAEKPSFFCMALERIASKTSETTCHAMPFDATSYVLTFLENYAEENAILLPGRIPAYKRDDIKLLPPNQKIWEYYVECCKSVDIQAAAKTTFIGYWRMLAPQIKVGKPKTDLCWTCQQNNSLIMKSLNTPASQKTAVSYKQ